MLPNSCECNPKNVNPAEHFYAKGRVHVFMVLNFREYLTEKSKEDFESLRGSKDFVNAIRELMPSSLFTLDNDDESTLEKGHDFQVFRRHLIRDWLFPTYHLQKDLVDIPENSDLAKDLKKYELRIRLSRAGFFEVRLTREINKNGEKIIDILSNLMELRSHKDGDDTISPQLKLVLFCVDMFLESLQHKIIVTEASSKKTILDLPKNSANLKKLPYRQRYITLFLEEIFCTNCDKKRVEADTLKTKHWQSLAAMLEGVLIRVNDNSPLIFPAMDSEVKKKIEDLASWKDDLCLFAPERCLIYFPEEKIIIPSRSGTISVSYKDYWECIVRGIEHTLSIRAALQSIEYYTTSTLESDPRLIEKVVDGNITKEDKKDIRKMTQAFSYAYKTLPMLRDILVPSSSYRASYAVNKFEYLNKILNMDEIRSHVERNVDELVSFIQFYSSMELQQELNQSQAAIDRAGFIITIFALFIAAPSFLVDFIQFLSEEGFEKPYTTNTAVWVFAVIFLILVLSFARQISGIISKFSERMFKLKLK